nr:MAG TPA: hypothetical protein [Caudoviricetes sp.]
MAIWAFIICCYHFISSSTISSRVNPFSFLNSFNLFIS